MKRPSLLIGIFLLACLTGTAVAIFFVSFDSDSTRNSQTAAALTNEVPPFDTDFSASFNPEIDYSRQLDVKLITTGNFLFKNAPYKGGENWLALFRNEDGYELAPTKIKVTNELYRQISTVRKNDSIFLLRHSVLKAKSVETVFDQKNDDFSFSQDKSKSFIFNGINYQLRVENGRNGYLREGSALTLESAGKRQVLRVEEDPCDNCSWSLIWAGDLDGDGKLDLYLDLSPYYWGIDNVLFLSSSAGLEEMVGIVAVHSGPGC